MEVGSHVGLDMCIFAFDFFMFRFMLQGNEFQNSRGTQEN
jgi:hypothetical protein